MLFLHQNSINRMNPKGIVVSEERKNGMRVRSIVSKESTIVSPGGFLTGSCWV
jgi:hypothetical protein